MPLPTPGHPSHGGCALHSCLALSSKRAPARVQGEGQDISVVFLLDGDFRQEDESVSRRKKKKTRGEGDKEKRKKKQNRKEMD